MSEERRRFQRITFDADCEVQTEACSWPVNLIDISFRGALTSVIITPMLKVGESADLVLKLSDDIIIRMPVILRHQLGEYLGFEAQNMDIDSISHLRRLVELNLGNEDLLERELEHLTAK
ncbi:PilZ domain-containing protein [Amphritea sp.]|jgi:hypothetical protein|uniref:PilZ domain-containing protein n=1 Tax=Amphritea sp. TaxID=1872502 RepID=UPI0025C127A9|nr:PilZ domain-containing protein [Amphritea sp.]